MGAGQSIPGEHLWDGQDVDVSGWPGLESMLCEHCGKANKKLRRCTACRGAFFCDRDCQRAAWPRHREVCGVRRRQQEGVASSSNSPRLLEAAGGPHQPGTAQEAFRLGLDEFRIKRFREALSKAADAATVASSQGLLELRSKALILRGQCFEQLGEFVKAKQVYAEALAEARADLVGSSATTAEANILLRLGAVATRSSQLGVAVQYQKKAVALLEADMGDKDSLAAAYNNLAISASQHGLQEAARSSFERALVLRKETGNVNGICACSTNLANLLRAQGKPQEAAMQLEEARRLASGEGNARLEQQVLLNLANLYENELQVAHPPDAGNHEALEDLQIPETEWATRALRCRRALLDLPEEPAASWQVPAPAATALRCDACGLDLRNRMRQLRCSRCRRSFYCSPECQRGAWREHSPGCQAPIQAPHASREAELRRQSCAICLEGLKLLDETRGNEKVTILECLHCLHTVCWTSCTEMGRDDCPVCRNNLGFSR